MTSRFASYFAAASLFATGIFALSLSACGDPATAGCQTDSDCREGRVCVRNQCTDPSIGGLDAGTDAANSSTNNGSTNNGTANNSNNSTTNNSTTDAGADMATDMGTTDGGTDMAMPDMDPMPVFGPQISVSPVEVDFGIVPEGSSVDATIRVSNVGDDVLNLTNVELDAMPSQGFAVSAPNTTVQPGGSVDVVATFAPPQNADYANAVVIESNDADDASVSVPLTGRAINSTFQPCFFASPPAVDFGVVPAGTTATASVTVGNCTRNADVTFATSAIVDNTPGFSESSNAPVVLAPGDTSTFDVSYTATTNNPASAVLRLESNAQLGDVIDIDLNVAPGCAEANAFADIAGLQNDIPQKGPLAIVAGSDVNLDGTQSTTPTGSADYTWSVTSAPAGSTAQVAGPTAAVTSFTPDVAGDYAISLEVTDPSSGAPSCGADTIEITALAQPSDIVATVRWNADHDIDLHVLRDDGNGNWPAFGDTANDLHFGALWLDWGAANDRSDDAFHLGDDSDGFGPEAAAIAELESGRDYRIVAHFDDADGLRPAVFSVDASLQNRTSVIPGQQNERRNFNVAEEGIYWIIFEIDGATGNATFVNQVTR